MLNKKDKRFIKIGIIICIVLNIIFFNSTVKSLEETNLERQMSKIKLQEKSTIEECNEYNINYANFCVNLEKETNHTKAMSCFRNCVYKFNEKGGLKD